MDLNYSHIRLQTIGAVQGLFILRSKQLFCSQENELKCTVGADATVYVWFLGLMYGYVPKSCLHTVASACPILNTFNIREKVDICEEKMTEKSQFSRVMSSTDSYGIVKNCLPTGPVG